jgi:putative transposase
MIAEPWRNELHAYLGGIVKDLNGVPECIDGPFDHVHLLIGLKATHTLSEVVRQIKRGSSEWIHHHNVRKFQWQEGYAAFTVSASQLDKVNQYIRNQINHHSKRSFEEEYLSLLRGSRISFDEKYLW